MQHFNMWIYRAVGSFLSRLPTPAFYFCCDLLRLLLQYILRYRRQVILTNLHIAFPDLPSPQRKSLLSQYYRSFADLSLETLIGPYLSATKLNQRFRAVNPEVIAKERNSLIAGAHQGNWEWGVLAVAHWWENPTTGVYKPLKNKPLNEHLKKRREQWGLHTIPEKQTLRWLLSNAEEPGQLVLIADQSPSNAKTARWVDFFGTSTAFSGGPEKIAEKTGWPVFFFEVRREDRGRYAVEFKPMEKGPGLTQRYARALENSIRAHPAEWLWSHKRWKKTVKY